MTSPTAAGILARLDSLAAMDLPTRGGRTMAYVYDSGVEGLDEIAAAAHARFMHANALDPTAFPSLTAMEGDLVASTASLVGGDPTAGTVGTVTSGGTESCLLAVLAARDGRPEVTAPRMVLPASAHAAFFKAAHYFGVAVDVVAVDPVTTKADPVAMAAAMTDATVLVVVSAPSYAHGVIDPIGEIAAAAAARGVRCHVDACIGGWLLGWWRRIGVDLGSGPIAPFGLDVPGVTSVSVDLHKYAYTPKGASVLLHARPELRASQFFVFADWPGYAMLNTTLQSTRSGGPIAAAWATLSRLGAGGYEAIARRTAEAVVAIRDGMGAVEGLELIAPPEAALIAAVAAEGGPSVFAVADEMAARGYYVQPQFAHRGAPASLHMTITAANRGHEAELLAALGDSVAAARTNPPEAFPDEAIAGLLAADLSSPAGLEAAAASLGLAGPDGSLRLPQRMAAVNTLLDALPAAAREAVLSGVLSLLTAPGADLLAGE